MKFIGLVLFLVFLYYIVKFFYAVFSHLFQVFDWIGTDITKAAIGIGADVTKSAIGIIEISDDKVESLVPEHHEDTTREDELEQESVGQEIPLLHLLFHMVVYIFTGITLLFLHIMELFSLYIMTLPQKIVAALRMPLPKRLSIWYFELFLCFFPMVIFLKVPDIYGFSPVIHAVYVWLGFYLVFMAIIYFFRIFFTLDIETVFQSGSSSHTPPEQVSRLIQYRHILYGLIVLAISISLIANLFFIGIFLLGFFYSLLYFIAFRNRGDPGFTFRKFVFSWIIFAAFIVTGILVIRYGSSANAIAGFTFPIGIMTALIILNTLWMMSRKYEVGDGFRELPLRQFGSWFNQFVTPFLKLAVSAPLFYFPLLFFSIMTFEFLFSLAVVTAVFLQLHKFRAKIPRFLPRGLFAGYICLVWVSIFFVQSYNRIYPTLETCSAIEETTELRHAWTMEKFRLHDFLDRALPYDAVLDPDDNSLFITFKNLTEYGAVARINMETGELTDHLVTENNVFPGELFYPERLCINRTTRQIYSTTKSSNNFQLLVMDYKNGLKLTKRIPFQKSETTNCEVDERNGDIYVMFLGPPKSHFRVIDPVSHEEKGIVHFGVFGYADYFALDTDNDRVIVPSLDPVRRFLIYNVTSLKNSGYINIKKKVPVKFRLAGLEISTPLPTLGIARDSTTNKIYFTCPFIRLVFEVDGDSFKVLRTIYTGRFPREIAVNEKSGLLLVANYGDGTINVIDLKTWKKIKKFQVGKLVRSISVEPKTGRTFVVTACGVFELVL